MNKATFWTGLLLSASLFCPPSAAAQAPVSSPNPAQAASASRPDPYEDMFPTDDPQMIEMSFVAEFMRATAPAQAYMADTEKEVAQVLADGTRISRTTNGRVARDSQGRTWSTMNFSGAVSSGGSEQAPEMVMILDFPGHTMLMLMPATKMAMKMVLPDTEAMRKQAGAGIMPGVGAPGASAGQSNRSSTPPSAETLAFNPFFSKDTHTESLGEQNMAGVIAQGKRYTVTIPAGAVGNDRPIEVTAERWYSKELQATVMARLSDPRKGDATFRLVNIHLDEPPASLFDIPSDYTIREMKIPFGPFTPEENKAVEKPASDSRTGPTPETPLQSTEASANNPTAGRKGAQSAPSQPADEPSCTADGARVGTSAIRGHPFSARIVWENSHVVEDGTQISQKSLGFYARDSQGRTHRAQGPYFPADLPESRHMITRITLYDPQTKSSITLVPKTKMATKTVYPLCKDLAQQAAPGISAGRLGNVQSDRPSGVEGAPAQTSGGQSESARSRAHTEPLGEMNIEGLIARGTRTVRSIPVGQVGNDKRLEIVQEEWYAPEIQEVILREIRDPRQGDTVFRLTNIQIGEPPANLFEIPSDYTTGETTGPVSKSSRHSPPDSEALASKPPEKP